jgi:ABC-2 type transport system ATP-binding protein
MVWRVSPVIEVFGLRKRYKRLGRASHKALDGFDMVVEAGQVHGFLGPNGSGKTTTLRTMLGLVRANGGVMRVLGEPVPQRLPQIVGRVGAIVESPQFFPNFSGRRTLDLLATAGKVDRRRVDAVLDTVGLTERARDRVKTYSLGMKQRLAVASALLKEPDLLILDEPANGLDPAGIREMRDLMRQLASDGVTVVLSSHILGEIQQICDSVTIISAGRRVAFGPVADVLARADKGEFRVRVADAERAVGLLTAVGSAVQRMDDHLVVSDVTDPAGITETLGREGLWVSELTPLVPDLEHVFLELTASAPSPRSAADDAPAASSATGKEVEG